MTFARSSVLAFLCAALAENNGASWNTCSVLSSRSASTGHFQSVTLKSTGQYEKDRECCNACAQLSQCTHWTRSTTDNVCMLREGAFQGDHVDTTSRLGFKGQQNLLCTKVHLAYGVLGELVKRVPISLGQTIQDFYVELPNTLQCTAASTDNTEVAILGNMTILGHGGFDIASGTAAGTAQMFIKATPEVSVDFNTCSVEVTTPGIWDLGVGIDNVQEGWQWLTNWLSGKFHAGFKSSADCSGPMPALPGRANRYPAGYISGGEFELFEQSQVERDQHCCRACASRSDCDVFEISDKDGPLKTNKCKLKAVAKGSKSSVPTHANFRGNSTPLDGLRDMEGVDVGVQFIAFTDQTEFDTRCSAACDEIDECEHWVASVGGGVPRGTPGNCWLKKSTIPKGLINSGVFGLSGRTLLDWLGSYVLKGMLTKVIQRMCQQDEALQGLLDADTAMTGGGHVALDVDEQFLASFSGDPSTWATATFPVTQRSLSNIKTEVEGLQEFADAVKGDFGDALAEDLAQQVATPVAFFFGGILTRCIHQGSGKCDSSTLEELMGTILV